MTTGKKPTGFAALSPERRRELASRGGRAAHARGTAYKWSLEEAREAGKKGGEAVSQDVAHMSAIGRIGAEAVAKKRRKARDQERAARLHLERERSVEVTSERRRSPVLPPIAKEVHRDREQERRLS